MLRTQRMIGLLILLALLFSACQPIVTEPMAQSSAEDVTAAINAIWDEYEASILAGDPDRWIELWEEDGVQLPPGNPPVAGREAIYDRISNDLASTAYSEFAITNEDVEVNGDLAFARGNYVLTFAPKSGGEPMDLDGKYMTIFHQQPDGSWKIYRDIFNSNVPPAPVAAPATDAEAVAEAINAVWREYEASILAGDPDRWIELWEEDGVQLPPGNLPVAGKEAIYDRISNDLASTAYSEFVITNEDVEVNGDLAFARGNYVLTFAPKSGGEPMDLDGKYMTIFHQQPDGSWKIYRDIFNSNVPPAPAAAPATDEDVTAAVNAVWDEYEASQMAGDPDRWIALWTDEGVKMPPDVPAIDGTDQIFARAQRNMADPVDEMVITALETQSAGDWAYSRGVFTFTYTINETGEQEMMDGKFMTILQRQPDGSWKIHRDIHNWNGPPTPVEATTEAEDATTAIDAFWREYEASVLAGNAERCDKLWTEAGVQAPSDLPAAVLEEATFPVAANAVEHDDFSQFVINNEAVEVHDDWALARGTYMARCTPKEFNDLIELEGEYMAIFLQQADGSWKLYQDLFESGS